MKRSWLKWTLLALSIAVAGYLFITAGTIAAFVFLFTRAAESGQIEEGSTIYAAKDPASFALLAGALEGQAYLYPSDIGLILEKSRGGIVALRSKTPVRYEGEYSLAGDRLPLAQEPNGNSTPHVLKIKVLGGPAKGATVMVPQQYTRAVHFAGRGAAL